MKQYSNKIGQINLVIGIQWINLCKKININALPEGRWLWNFFEKVMDCRHWCQEYFCKISFVNCRYRLWNNSFIVDCTLNCLICPIIWYSQGAKQPRSAEQSSNWQSNSALKIEQMTLGSSYLVFLAVRERNGKMWPGIEELLEMAGGQTSTFARFTNISQWISARKPGVKNESYVNIRTRNLSLNLLYTRLRYHIQHITIYPPCRCWTNVNKYSKYVSRLVPVTNVN